MLKLNRSIIASSCIATSFCDPIFFNYVIGKRKHVSIYKRTIKFNQKCRFVFEKREPDKPDNKSQYVKFRGKEILVHFENEKPYVLLKSIFDNMGLQSWTRQKKRLKENIELKPFIIKKNHKVDKKIVSGTSLPLDKLDLWLSSINENNEYFDSKVKEEIISYKQECSSFLKSFFVPKNHKFKTKLSKLNKKLDKKLGKKLDKKLYKKLYKKLVKKLGKKLYKKSKFIFGISKLKAIIKLSKPKKIKDYIEDLRFQLKSITNPFRQSSPGGAGLHHVGSLVKNKRVLYNINLLQMIRNLNRLKDSRYTLSKLSNKILKTTLKRLKDHVANKKKKENPIPWSFAKIIRFFEQKIIEKEQQKKVPVFVRKMARIYVRKSENLYIINIEQTIIQIKRTFNVVKEIINRKGHILFINSNPDFSGMIKNTAKLTSQSYINHKWINGLLTNWKHFHQSKKRFQTFESNRIKRFRKLTREFERSCKGSEKNKQSNRPVLHSLPPKYQKLKNGFEGLRADRSVRPDLLIVLDPSENINAILEADKLNIPVISLMGLNTIKKEITLNQKSNRLTPPKLLGCQSTPFSSVSYPIFCNENSIEFNYSYLNLLTNLIRKK